jgi:hypothetical protein
MARVGAAGLQEVTHQEEEGEHELSLDQPLPDIHDIHRVGFGDDAAHRVQPSVPVR